MIESKTENLTLMVQNVEARYVHDGNGRISGINTWDGGVVPHFFLGRTNNGNVWRFRYDVPRELVREVTRYCIEEPLFTGSEMEPIHRQKYEQLFTEHSGTAHVEDEITYICDNDLYLPDSAIVKIDETTAHFLEGCMDDWLPDVPHTQPFFAIVKGGQVVSVCASVRITDNAHSAGVETLPEFRGKGYAASAVLAWASAVKGYGASPLYSHSRDNVASQNVARKLEMKTIGADYFIG